MPTIPPDARLFPDIEPHASGWLPVGDGHHLYWERCGNPRGRPLLWLHGGPGSGASARQRRQFDPRRWCVTLFDQRGCGRSRHEGGTAPARLASHNTTAHLLADLECLRTAAGVRRWTVAGGSWGATLALAYAASRPGAVEALLLRSPFLASAQETQALLSPPARLRAAGGQGSAAASGWAFFLSALGSPAHETPDRRLARAWTALDGPDRQRAELAALGWSVNEWLREGHEQQEPKPNDASSQPAPDWGRLFPDRAALLRRVHLQCHYLRHGCFIDMAAVLARLARSGGTWPAEVVCGEGDQLCPPRNADAIAAALGLDGKQVWRVPQAGHAAFAPGLVRAWRAAADRLAQRLEPAAGVHR